MPESKEMKNRVLAIRLSSLGDIILCQPVLQQLQAQGYQVDF